MKYQLISLVGSVFIFLIAPAAHAEWKDKDFNSTPEEIDFVNCSYRMKYKHANGSGDYQIIDNAQVNNGSGSIIASGLSFPYSKYILFSIMPNTVRDLSNMSNWNLTSLLHSINFNDLNPGRPDINLYVLFGVHANNLLLQYQVKDGTSYRTVSFNYPMVDNIKLQEYCGEGEILGALQGSLENLAENFEYSTYETRASLEEFKQKFDGHKKLMQHYEEKIAGLQSKLETAEKRLNRMQRRIRKLNAR